MTNWEETVVFHTVNFSNKEAAHRYNVSNPTGKAKTKNTGK